ncbi:hypothetical protein [Burkholderia multivorans]|uniref:Uncharacterized protein n=1 Tax=Burkholderia multivorans CGD2 TaxID=513052 RepID=B9BHQ6_9BURK|nr:hypothetical protein [Burkholderia multivorans]EEE09239.1 hypothetical protein BURMUCGD2_4611 [Burkholderia multivorans CGD2]EEE15157.1 hypothetical protein BURMUCGD2M_4599 [Burkholderia multivorans CGD2M]
MKIEILNCWTLKVIFECEADSMKVAVELACKQGVSLSDANLSGADLLPIKADFIEVISQAPREVPALIEALKAGRVDGSTYSGECACLVGTIANARGIDVDSAELGIPKDASRPVERFFMAIRKGDTPETNAASKLALEWAETWLDTQRKAFAS